MSCWDVGGWRPPFCKWRRVGKEERWAAKKRLADKLANTNLVPLSLNKLPDSMNPPALPDMKLNKPHHHQCLDWFSSRRLLLSLPVICCRSSCSLSELFCPRCCFHGKMLPALNLRLDHLQNSRRDAPSWEAGHRLFSLRLSRSSWETGKDAVWCSPAKPLNFSFHVTGTCLDTNRWAQHRACAQTDLNFSPHYQLPGKPRKPSLFCSVPIFSF